MREKVAIIFGEKLNFQAEAFKYFILSLNMYQEIYEFTILDPASYLVMNPEIKEWNENLFHEYIVSLMMNDNINNLDIENWIIIFSQEIAGRLFFVQFGRFSFITTDYWEKYFSPPSVFEYLLQCIIASLIDMKTDYVIPEHRIETFGSVTDYTRLKVERKASIIIGGIDDNSKELLLDATNQEYVDGVQKILGRSWIGTVKKEDFVAFNLKKYYKYDIDRDSGLKKTSWEKIKDTFIDFPKDTVNLIVKIIIAAVLTALLVSIGFKK